MFFFFLVRINYSQLNHNTNINATMHIGFAYLRLVTTHPFYPMKVFTNYNCVMTLLHFLTPIYNILTIYLFAFKLQFHMEPDKHGYIFLIQKFMHVFLLNYKIYPTTNIWHLIFVLTIFLIQRKMPLKPQNKEVLTFDYSLNLKGLPLLKKL